MTDRTRTVSDVMTQPVVAVSGGATVKEMVATVEKWKVSALPVITGDGRVVGVVSEADLLLKEEFRGTRLTLTGAARRPGAAVKAVGTTAGELMSSPVITVDADATLPKAARIMARRRVKRLPVTDASGRLVGVVSRSDLLKVFLRSDEEIAREVREQVVPPLFHEASPQVEVGVEDGLVTLSGVIPDTSLVPVLARLARSVEGVVDVDCQLSGRP